MDRVHQMRAPRISQRGGAVYRGLSPWRRSATRARTRWPRSAEGGWAARWAGAHGKRPACRRLAATGPNSAGGEQRRHERGREKAVEAGREEGDAPSGGGGCAAKESVGVEGLEAAPVGRRHWRSSSGDFQGRRGGRGAARRCDANGASGAVRGGRGRRQSSIGGDECGGSLGLAAELALRRCFAASEGRPR